MNRLIKILILFVSILYTSDTHYITEYRPSFGSFQTHYITEYRPSFGSFQTHYITEYRPSFGSFQTIYLTNSPDNSDIIVVCDIDLISDYEILFDNYHSSYGSIVKNIMITKIENDGEIIHLSNGSVYKVLFQTYLTSLWMEYSSVTIVNGTKMINDYWKNDQIDVYRIK